MKSFVNTLALASLALLIGFSSCKKSVSTPGSPASTDSVTAALTSGTWVVASLVQKKEDNTSKFAGYTFTFSTNGKLTATLNGVATAGTWSHTPAVTYYGSSSREAMVISLGNDNLFKRLSKTWNVVSKSANVLQLENPEILEDEHLQLQKN